ncbi:MAG: hypothetical protein M9904_06470 [Chitinophagaceae bacterium]|nr:hypothetical protein [Chitinophagaceae bacterium]
MLVAITILLISLGSFIFLGWLFSHKAEHEEKMKLIEKGIKPDMIRNDGSRVLWKKMGIIAVGLGCGLFIISILVWVNPKIVKVNSMPLAILIVCCGISLIVSNKEKRP